MCWRPGCFGDKNVILGRGKNRNMSGITVDQVKNEGVTCEDRGQNVLEVRGDIKVIPDRVNNMKNEWDNGGPS